MTTSAADHAHALRLIQETGATLGGHADRHTLVIEAAERIANGDDEPPALEAS